MLSIWTDKIWHSVENSRTKASVTGLFQKQGLHSAASGQWDPAGHIYIQGKLRRKFGKQREKNGRHCTKNTFNFSQMQAFRKHRKARTKHHCLQLPRYCPSYSWFIQNSCRMSVFLPWHMCAWSRQERAVTITNPLVCPLPPLLQSFKFCDCLFHLPRDKRYVFQKLPIFT